MTWFRRRPDPDLVNVRLPSTTDDCGHIVVAVPERAAAGINVLDTRIRDLEEENEAFVASVREMREHHRREHERQQNHIASLNAVVREQEAQLDTKDAFIRALNRAYDRKQVEVDNALAECKRLHGLLSSADAENLQTQGELATAREEIAGLKLAVTP